MSQEELLLRFEQAGERAQLILAVLAVAGEPTGHKRIADMLALLGADSSSSASMSATLSAAPSAELASALAQLRAAGMSSEVNGRGMLCAPALVWPALRAAQDRGGFGALRRAYLELHPLRHQWDGLVMLRSYRQGVALLRMALVGGDEPAQVLPLLHACLACYEAAAVHPLVDICARPFDAAMFARIHPQLRDEVLTVLLVHAQREPHHAGAVRRFAEHHVATAASSMALRTALAEHLILCGRLDDAGVLLVELDVSHAQFFRSVIALLRDDHRAAIDGFELATKALRRETGKRRACFDGIGGHLHVLALLRSDDKAHHKLADALLENAARAPHNHDSAVYAQLSMLRHIRNGTVDAAVLPSRNWEGALQATMFRALLHYWLSLAQLGERRVQIEESLASAMEGGFELLAAQLAGLLGRIGGPGAVGFEQQAIALRQRHRIADLAEWFEREEPWQRQLNALINLQPAVNVEAPAQTRLVWMVRYDAHYGVQELEPREQKCDARGGWSRGRAVALKRLLEDGEQLDFLSAQDLQAIGAIGTARHYQGARYELDIERALVCLLGHPLLFWADAPASRVELLPGEPELLVKKRGATVTITLNPPVDGADSLCVTRETPTRLRLVRIGEEHRRIGAIVGAGLEVPLAAEQQLLRAIGAVSSIVTVQSDIGSSAADIEQVDADPRLHVHLLPYQQGLRMQLLVRPLPGAGAYYPPGSGLERVIADSGGVRVEARRRLSAEREAERALVGACHALDEAESEHGEWLLGQPLACLELLAQLQALDPATVLLAWPEGESMRITRKADSNALRLSIRRERDWFAASAELSVDEDRVLDLRTLLDALGSGHGRFIALGENEFLALSEQLHKRLLALTDYGQLSGRGVQVHRLATVALEELAQGIGDGDSGGSVDSDRAWREHLERMAGAAAFTPQLPATLQAELRDYQQEGYAWLARLAHWGVGACLADDMGLGKTLQTLALLVARAPQGPALVVAPSSVCLNWQSEAARFAPTLKVRLFGAGARADTVQQAGPFDIVIASYGLLQQEAALFAGMRWNSIVLDEAQAIKNGQTKRSQAVMALQGEFRMVATGTPLENHLGELWNLFRFINPGLLGTLDQFNLRLAGPIEKAQDARAAAAARTRLRRLVQPFILRRTKAQVLSELPSRTEITVPVELTADETALYESLRRAALERLAALEAPERSAAIQILAEMMKLRRACCNPALVAPELGLASSKLIVFARLLDGLLENHHKVLVFSQFVDHLALIRALLEKRGIAYQYLDGATSMAQRKARIDAFQGGAGDVFLISLKAGGVGINLTAADYVIHMDPWWNPAVEDQASDRAHRIGQQRPVTIYRLVARNTIEEGIVELHRHKRELADTLLEGTDAAARMSAAQMLALLGSAES